MDVTAGTKANGHANKMPPTVSPPGQNATKTKAKRKRARSAKAPATAARQSPAPTTTKTGRPLAVFLGTQLAALGASTTTTTAQLDTFWNAMNDAWPLIRRAA